MGKWTNDEIDYLKNNYPEYGVNVCIENLKRSKLAILSKVSELNLKRKNILEKNIDDISFIRKNYPKFGGKYCAIKLNKNEKYVKDIAFRLKIKVDSNVKRNNFINILKNKNINKYDVNNIINIRDKEISYFLGYFWADGHIGSYSSKLSSISLIEEDAIHLFTILNSINNSWSISEPIEKYWINSEKERVYVKRQRKIHTNSIEIFEFLEKNDFSYKSVKNFNKIWNVIPENLKSYFVMGLFDGDGSFSINKTKNKYINGRIVFVSTYDYDWSTLENYLIDNNIKYKIYKSIVNLGKSSRLVISSYKSILDYYNLIYVDKNFWGLERKYIKIKNFLNEKK
jgi:hypothetical protein